jgi:hypothetical protein
VIHLAPKQPQIFTNFQTPITQQQMAQNTHRELSRNEKVAMITLFHLEYRISVICHTVNRPWPTARDFIQRAT